MEAPEKCGKCGKALDTTGAPKWCKQCRADYQRDYQGGKQERAIRQGFALGVQAMRQLLAKEFDAQGGGMFSGVESAELIQRAPGPRFDECVTAE